MKIGAAYIRVSTDEQLELSPDSQLKKIKEYAKAHEIVLSDRFIFKEEEGRSGRNAKRRPAFQQMVGMAKDPSHPFDIILVWKYSRFARNQEESIVYKSMLRSKCGVDVVSASEPLVDGPFGSLIERIIEWMDEYYSIRLSGEVLRGMTEKASRGGVVGSPAFGYLAENGTFVPDPDRAQFVPMIFNKFIEGMGCRDIAMMLNNMGVRTRKGGSMENRTIEQILQNPVYIGKIRWSTSGESGRNLDNPNIMIADGHHQQLINEEVFERAQEVLADRRKMYRKYAHQSDHVNEYMLRGLVRCSDCGSTLVLSNKGLQCHSYARGVCKVSHYISVSIANERVISAIEEIIKQPNFPVMIKKARTEAVEADLINGRIQRERLKLERIRAAYEDGIDTLEEYRANKAKIAETISALEAQRPASTPPGYDVCAEFVQKHKDVIKDLRNPELTEAQKNSILRGFVDQIVFDRFKNQFQIFFYL